MGRPEAPIPQPHSALGQLAKYLRAIKSRRGWNYEQLEALTGLSVSTLSRAAGGKKLPTLKVAQAYNQACAGSEDVRELWEEAYKEVRHRGSNVTAPRVDLVFDRADLGAALLKAYREGEAKSVRDVERRAEARARQFGPLSRSTAHRIIKRWAIPTSRKQLRAFLFACGVPSKEHHQWELAWIRVQSRFREDETESPLKFFDHSVEDANREMRSEGFDPLEGYRGPRNSWTCRCLACREIVRVRFIDVYHGKAECVACAQRRRDSLAERHRGPEGRGFIDER